MYVQRPVAFGTINFLPGFPSDSVYQCDPWSTTSAGRCADGPSVIGRETGNYQAGAAIQRALAEVTGRPSLAVGELAVAAAPQVAHHHDSLSGIGDCGCGGKCGGCGSGAAHHHDSLMGMGAYGLPDLATVTADPLGYLQANAFPIVLGALAVYLIKKR